MLEVSRAKLRGAEQMFRAGITLAQVRRVRRPGVQLLTQTLQERMHQFVDLSLLALQSSDRDEHIGVVRAGRQSQNRRQVAEACELLSGLSHRDLARGILALVDEGASEAAIDRSPAFPSLSAMLEWASSRLDPWLSDCAGYCAESLSH